jgi:hypothetical protein
MKQARALGNYLGAHVGWKVARAFDAEAKRRGKRRRGAFPRRMIGVGGLIISPEPCAWQLAVFDRLVCAGLTRAFSADRHKVDLAKYPTSDIP